MQPQTANTVRSSRQISAACLIYWSFMWFQLRRVSVEWCRLWWGHGSLLRGNLFGCKNIWCPTRERDWEPTYDGIVDVFPEAVSEPFNCVVFARGDYPGGPTQAQPSLRGPVPRRHSPDIITENLQDGVETQLHLTLLAFGQKLNQASRVKRQSIWRDCICGRPFETNVSFKAKSTECHPISVILRDQINYFVLFMCFPPCTSRFM